MIIQRSAGASRSVAAWCGDIRAWRHVLLALALLASGCAHAHAKAITDAPPLDAPAPPPRDVTPSDTEAPPPMPLVPEPAHNAPARPRPAPREQPRTDPPKADTAKPEAPPVDAPAKAVEEPVKPPLPTNLQTAPTLVEGEVERGIRASIAKATADLNRVDYRALNADARTQYDTAKRFIGQADEAMRARNLVFAKNLAEKAAALAGQLSGR